MRIKTKKPGLAEVDMTPMIDIVFQLIAFFMVISNFEQTQADERVKLPRDELAKPPDYKVEHELVLNIGFLRDKDGNKTDPEPWVFYPEGQVRVLDFGPHFALESRLFTQRGIDPKEVTIVIRADRDTPTGLVQELIKLAQDEKALFTKFALKATQKVD